MKALMIVAHPDDEIIWAGGLILQNPDWEWTVFSLCRADDPDRAPKFEKVCKNLNAQAIITNLDDKSPQPLSKESIKEVILEKISQKKYEKIFTHGSNGEYGHIRHIEIHRVVKELMKEEKLNCDELWYFDYIPGNEKSGHDKETVIPIPNEKSDWVIELTEDQFETKQMLIQKVYGYKPPIIETQAAGKIEAFKQHKK